MTLAHKNSCSNTANVLQFPRMLTKAMRGPRPSREEYKNKQQIYNISYDRWLKIKRADNPDKCISEKVCRLLSKLVYKFRKQQVITISHDYLSKITRCKYQQNNNLLNQLKDVLNIEFYRSTKVGSEKRWNRFVITKKEHTDKLLSDPENFYKEQNLHTNEVALEANKINESTDKKLAQNKQKISTTIYKEEGIYNSSPYGDDELYIPKDTLYSECIYSVAHAREEQAQNQPLSEQPKAEPVVQIQPKEENTMLVFDGTLRTERTASIYDIFNGVVNRPLQNMNNPIRTNENRYNAPLPPYGQSKYTHDYGHDRIQKLLTLIPREFSPETSALLKEQQYFYSEADNKLTIRVKTKPQLTENEREAFIKLTVSVFGEAPRICYQIQKPMPESEETEYVPKPVHQVNEPLHWPADEMPEHHPDYWERLRMSLAIAYGKPKVNAWLRDVQVAQIGKVITVTCTQCVGNYITDNFLSRLQEFCRENHGVTISFNTTDVIGQKAKIEVTEKGKFCESLKKPNNDWMRQ